MNAIKTLLKIYLICAGISVHLFAFGIFLIAPDRVRDVYYRGSAWMEIRVPSFQGSSAAAESQYSIEEEIALNFGSWQPLANLSESGEIDGIWVNDKKVGSLKEASRILENGDLVQIGAGTYQQALIVRADDVTVVGIGHVVIEKASAEGKAAIITKGNNIHIKNIECRYIEVRDKNGACVRHEGQDLTLTHVYFHHSQQGLLAGGNSGIILIEESRFERLGLNGRAHGIYVNGGTLILKDSLVVASKSQGHEVKSRAAETIIENSVIASLSATDSRLIDIPNGGVLKIEKSILQMGVNSSNQDLIGYGLEKRAHTINRVELTDNLIVMERNGNNALFHKHNRLPDMVAQNNLIVAAKPPELEGFNLLFTSRSEAGLEAYPKLPKIDQLVSSVK